jgi:uncharacterized membrane protein (DUF373 family)
MSATATTAKNHSQRKHHHKRKMNKKAHAGRQAMRAIKRIDTSVHYSVALVLIGLAVVMLGEIMWTLLTTSSALTVAASNAIGGFLFVLIIVEITCTVTTSPDNNGVALRRLLVIVIISALRELLWLGVHPSLDGITNSGQAFNRPLDLGLSTAVVLALAVSLTLVRRISGGQ